MADIEKLVGDESRLELGQKINEIIDDSANKDLSNLSEIGEARFSDILAEIATNKSNISSLTTTVNGKISATINKAQTGSFATSNGAIINWGRTSVNASTTATATFKTPFTSTNYKVVLGLYHNDAGSQKNYTTYTYTTTNFVIYNGQSNKVNYDWLAIGY